MNWDEDLDREPATTVTKRSTLVMPALPERKPARVEILPPATMPELPGNGNVTQPLSRARSMTTGSHVDRAHALSHVTGRLALTFGGLSVIVGVVGFGVPVVSLAVLAWFGTAYALVWLVAYVLHVIVTPEGSAWLHVWSAWRWLGREQKHRHAIEWREHFPEDDDQ